jgi:cytochrome c peroxidase
MLLSRVPIAISLIMSATFCIVVHSAEKTDAPSDDAKSFRKSTLLQRFDLDQDGELTSAERKKLHAAFGGIAVPMLPDVTMRYTLRPPNVSEAELRKLDNSPDSNPLTDAGATLGRVLFYDRQLSKNNTIACASCHLQERAFADPKRLSTGFKGGQTGRNAMALFNLRYTVIRGQRPGFFWDERAETLEDQVLMPIQDPVEMGMKLPELVVRLQALPYYQQLFTSAFGTADVTSDRIAKAIAQFMRGMLSFDSKYDRAMAVGNGSFSDDFAAFTPQENLGKSLFIDGVGGIGEIGCALCHIPPTFGMPRAFNNGLDPRYADKGLGARDVPSNDLFTPSNDGKFKSSPLRNIALTAPYMHDGRFKTLEEVIEHYSDGVHPHVNLGLAFSEDVESTHKKTSGFALTREQKSALIAFLNTLTDEKFIADSRFSDPFVRLED